MLNVLSDRPLRRNGLDYVIKQQKKFTAQAAEAGYINNLSS
jgi:hypothetical protein